MAAEKGGASRLELCSNLLEGGTTCSFGMLRLVKSCVGIPIHVLIRPRSGDFLYSKEELEVMMEDIRMTKQEGGEGVVLGILTPQGDVNTCFCQPHYYGPLWNSAFKAIAESLSGTFFGRNIS